VNVSLVMRAAGITAATAIGISGCGSDNNSSGDTGSDATTVGCASGSLSGQGSTFQQAMEQQWTGDFAGKCSGAQITYTGVGSGAGIEQFGLGKVDFAGSDVVMLDDEQDAADKSCGSTAIHVPITAGGIAVIYHVEGLDDLQLSAKTLALIFGNKVKTWDDAAIKADNPDADLPSTTIKAYHRADESGTTAVLTGFLDSQGGGAWTTGVGKESSRFNGGLAATGSDGVTAGVEQTEGGIGYAEVSYAQQNGLPTAKVKGPGDYTDISADTVTEALDSGFTVTASGADLAGTLDFAKMKAGYPISTVSYAIVCSSYDDADKGKLVKAYFDYVLGDGQQSADQLGFAPLPQTLLDKGTESIDSIN
jgi:phosphate transport system substrate-binding protein